MADMRRSAEKLVFHGEGHQRQGPIVSQLHIRKMPEIDRHQPGYPGEPLLHEPVYGDGAVIVEDITVVQRVHVEQEGEEGKENAGKPMAFCETEDLMIVMIVTIVTIVTVVTVVSTITVVTFVSIFLRHGQNLKIIKIDLFFYVLSFTFTKRKNQRKVSACGSFIDPSPVPPLEGEGDGRGHTLAQTQTRFVGQ
jgi:hypothetical protein